MKVCIIAEGSYPYISGGVSSWTHGLISSLQDVEFEVVSIMPKREERLEFKYNHLPNLINLKTLFLDDYLEEKPYSNKISNRITKEKDIMEKFIRFDHTIDWDEAVKLLSSRSQIGSSIDFLQSKVFWEIILKYYKESYPEEAFNEFFWTIRSMLLPLIHMLQSDLPEADIYHSVSTGYAGLLGLVSKVKYNKALVLTEHGIYAREREEEIIKAEWVRGIYKRIWINFFYFLSIGAYKKSDYVISLFNRNQMLQIELGANKKKTLVIPNGIDINKFDIEKRRHDGYNIGAVLRIVPIKDVKTLIRAFKIVKDKIEDVTLYLIGPWEEDKKYYCECKDMIESFGLNGDIKFTGRVDVLEHLKILDIMVLTSISEGQPLVILEGMAAEIPFVATDVGSCKELLYGCKNDTIGQAGIITKPVSPTETAMAIIKILKDDKLRSMMAKNGKIRVRKYYTKSRLINSYRNIYKSLE